MSLGYMVGTTVPSAHLESQACNSCRWHNIRPGLEPPRGPRNPATARELRDRSPATCPLAVRKTGLARPPELLACGSGSQGELAGAAGRQDLRGLRARKKARSPSSHPGLRAALLTAVLGRNADPWGARSRSWP